MDVQARRAGLTPALPFTNCVAHGHATSRSGPQIPDLRHGEKSAPPCSTVLSLGLALQPAADSRAPRMLVSEVAPWGSTGQRDSPGLCGRSAGLRGSPSPESAVGTGEEGAEEAGAKPAGWRLLRGGAGVPAGTRGVAGRQRGGSGRCVWAL